MPSSRKLDGPDMSPGSIRRVWSGFCLSGDPDLLAGLPAAIAESWKRSRASGVDPGLAQFPFDRGPAADPSSDARLVEVARPILNSLKSDLYSSSSLLTLTNAVGRIVYRDGNTVILRAADAINAVPGTLNREDRIGTNSVGTSLALGEVVKVERWQHYCETFWEWGDVGAPIINRATGEVLGAIDFAVHGAHLSPELIMAAGAAARGIEGLLLEQEMGGRVALFNQFARVAPSAAAIAIDGRGVVVAVTDAAAEILNSSTESLVGRAVNSLPGLQRLACFSKSQAVPAADHRVSIGDGVTAVIEPLRNSIGSVGNLVRLESSSRAPAKPAARWSPHGGFGELIGRHPAFQMAKNAARRVAGTDLPVLLQGETGTGKELFARAIHLASSRRNGPFVAVNCGAIPEELIASELFGYEKGAFTGAVNTGKRGKFVQANGGTIFLDEITETSCGFQTALLRALEDHAIVPVGGERAISVDVRVIAATNQNLHRALREGSLRQDLYYRLRGVPIALPALRERITDIPLLAQHFLARLGGGMSLSHEAEHLLLRHRWPGNVRELRSVLTSAAALTDGPVIQPTDLSLDPFDYCATDMRTPPRLDHADEADIEILRRAMEATSGNVKEAAKIMGIARSSLYRRLRKLNLERTWAWR